MGTITNVIKTMFTSNGADKVAKDAESVGRSQTRLGQASAGAGRQFAAQSSGLGGLVGAYAGAAATSFALQAAFTALSTAASSENIVKGTNALAAATGQQGPKILKSIQEITQGQLTLADTAQQVNIALSAGFSTTQIEKLSEVALKTSRALGRDLADSMQRLVRGTAKLEPELLDELGIFVRIDSAVKAYAKQNGVAAASLTEFERRQAFANAAIAEGDRKFSDINTSAPSAQKTLAQLQVQLSNLATELTQLVVNVITPFVNFISNDFGNLFVLFGGVFLLVFKKAATIFGEFISSTTSGWIAWADNIVLENELVKGSFVEATAAAAKFKTTVATRGLTGKQGVITTAPDGTALLEKSGKMGQTGISAKLGQEASAIRTKFMNNEILSTTELNRAKAVLTAITTENTTIVLSNGVAHNTNAKVLAKNTIAYADATMILAVYNGVLAKTSITTKIVNASTAAFKVGLVGLGVIASGMLGFFSWVFVIASVLDVLGVDVFGRIGTFFTSMTAKSEEFKSGVTGAFVAAAGGAKVFEDSLKRAGATQKDLEGTNDALLAGYSAIREAATSKANIGRARAAKLDPTQAQLISAAMQSLADAQARVIAEGANVSTESLLNVQYQKAILEGLKKYDAGVLSLIGSISAMTGLDTTAVADIISKSTVQNMNNGVATLQLFGMTIKKINGEYNIDNLTQAQKELVGVSFSATFAINEATKAYAAGTTSAEKLGGVIAGIRGELTNSEKALADYTNELVNNGMSLLDAKKAADVYFAGLENQLVVLTNLKEALQGYDAQIKGVSSSFSKDIKILDTITFDGLINSAGRFATSQVEIAKNQNDLLLSTLNANKALSDSYDSVTAGFLKQPSNMQELVAGSELYNITLKAAAGQLINSVIALEDINKQQKKNLETANIQLDILKQEVALEKLKAESSLQQDINEANISAMQGNLDISKEMLSLDESRLSLALQQLTAVDSIMKKIKDGDAKDINGALAGRQESATEAVGSLQGVVSTDKMNNAVEQYTTGINNALDRQSAIIAIEVAAREEFNRRELQNFDNETELLSQQNFNAQAKNAMDKEILINQAKLDKARLEAQKAIITAEAAVVQAQIDGYSSLAQIVDGFGGHIKALGDVLGQALTAAGIANAVSGVSVVTDLQGQISAKAVAASTMLTLATQTQTDTIDLQIASVGELTTLELQRLEVQRKSLVQQRADLMAQRSLQRGKLTVEQEAKLSALDNKLADLTTTAAGSGGADKAVERLTGRLADLKSSIDSSVNSALMGINDAIINGAEDGKNGAEVLLDAIRGIFTSIQEEVFKQTIANPLSDMISSWLVGGIEQLKIKDIRGSSLAGVLGSARGATGKDALAKNVMGDATVDKGAAFFKSAGEKINNSINSLGSGVNAAASVGANGLSSAAGLLATTTSTSTGVVAAANTAGASTLMSSLGPILAVLAVIAVIAALFSGKKNKSSSSGASTITTTSSSIAADAAASVPANLNSAPTVLNSIPKMAIGGLRDRQPTMLEPGEFVIRKPMVNRIGTSTLESMNATGKMPNAAPVINIKNEGTAKDATASPPRFDGEKYVIDIVMRDLANNGPIRKSLRGGAL